MIEREDRGKDVLIRDDRGRDILREGYSWRLIVTNGRKFSSRVGR